MRHTLLLPLAASLLGACGSTEDAPPADVPAYDPHPEPPAILRDVALIDDDVAFTRPYVPAHRTTMDGRVGLRVQGGPPGTDDLRRNLSFYLFAPERLEAPLLAGPAGPELLADPAPFDVPFPLAEPSPPFRLGHHALCDPTLPFPVEGERTNPYACGPDSAHDCYDLTVISATSGGTSAQLWGTPVTVEVAAPKTAGSHIVDVAVGEPVAGTVIPATVEFMEPAVTEDGRLLTGRLGRFPRAWTHPETGETLTRPYDLVYFQLPDDAEPCDITGWTDFHPISHAPYDPRMIGRYGLAAYPFRDTEGNPIPDGEDLGGTYPWVDREGANVFMTGVHGRIAEQSETRFPRRCVHPGCEELEETVDWDRGFLVGGLWTRGKFVLLDGMINNQDWAVGVTPAAHWMVDLYRTPEGEPVPVRFGAGRFITAFRNAGGPYPEGYTHNANILDSLQHLLNHHPDARPVTPRDVVWVMSSGVATEEIAFDDFMDPDALIVSNMTASITQLYDDEGRSLGIPHHHNGQVRTLGNPDFPLFPDYWLDPDADAPIHLQNAATSLRWKVPPYGLVEAGAGRVEPVALGGVEGRGFWMTGEAEIRYAVPAQDADVRARELYIGLFVDPRVSDPISRGLLTFPDGSAIRLTGRATLEYVARGRVLHRVELPDSHGWMHLAWRVGAQQQEVTLLVDGVAFDRFTSPTPILAVPEGDLVVGSPGQHDQRFRGWIDDFKVLLHDVNPEVACNHARGTLVRVDDHPAWQTVAERYPNWAHDAIAEAAGQTADTRFACFHDYSADYAAHLGNIPAGTASMREHVNFPEGPIRFGVPRPDSSTNPFCLSCHTADGRGGLSLEALTSRPGLPAEDDPRRQPDQPPRRVFGNIPAGWIPAGEGPGGPAEAVLAPPEGLLVDQWLLPGAQ